MARKFKTGDKVRLTSDTEANIPMTVDGYQIDEPRSLVSGEKFSDNVLIIKHQ